MKDTIGIITFHDANNCGSILQAYALQYTLEKKIGKKSEIINFSNAEQKNMYALFRKVHKINDLLSNIATIVFYPKFKRHYIDYQNFKKEHYCLSQKSYTSSQELQSMDKYFCLIAGSDQVWNLNCPDADDVYFLSFNEDVKKIAYAPSFGANNPNEYSSNPEKYKSYLKSFDWLSVRENNGKKWIKEATGRDIPVLLDPTLLLDKTEWDSVCEKDYPKTDYIFYYAFNYSDENNRLVKEIAQKYNMPVYILDIKSWVKAAAKYGIKITDRSGPGFFLTYIKHAKMVFTTSFHGTVFSVIFKKKFWFFDSAIHNPDDDRVYTLLEQLNLRHRLIKTDNCSDINIMEEINFDDCYSRLEKLKETSIAWLKNAINTDCGADL